ncbi:MAG: LacI family transcriptional regulator [candidate division KSB1 bacterium]|nr:LacI family transcriptional regulator [candidate division KSB1 bacterium]MDZ7366647.1 LacI family transcriptional regulator [candidate division KSB1 bacterium]MDZ7404658.1 LacI family transcriptional regulator [candidate division KSB1 bacterium]
MSSIRDIAKAAGVSISTVSKALNDSGSLSAATRQRIRDLAKRMNYHPNSFARGLAAKVVDNIGFVIDRAPGRIFSNPFYSVILEGIESELVKHEFNLLISAHASTERDSSLPTFVLNGTVAGLIIAGNMAPVFLQRLKEVHLPAVVVDNHLQDQSFDTINSDNVSGAEDMMRYLISLGHEQIGFLLGANRHPNMQARYRAYRDSVRQHHLPSKPGWIGRGDVTAEGGYQAMAAILQSGELPTAIFASNDAMALGAIKLLYERGLRVPQQISVVGFDNIFLAEHATPPLTTVDVDKIRMGQLAAQRLIEKLKNQDDPVRETIVPTRLIVRQSAVRPAARKVGRETT